MTTFLLVRHGRTAVTGRISGWTPGIHLEERGREEVEALCRRLAGVPLAAVYASPLERTRETAAPIARQAGLEVEILREIGEIDFGDWTGRSFGDPRGEDLWRRYHSFRTGTRIPAGESMLEVQARMIPSRPGRVRERPFPCRSDGRSSLRRFPRTRGPWRTCRSGSSACEATRGRDTGDARRSFPPLAGGRTKNGLRREVGGKNSNATPAAGF